MLNNILDATFRANPKYQLRRFDELSGQERELLSGLKRDPDFYGLLCPRERATTGIKSVCRDTAWLYITLREPGRLPLDVRQRFGNACNMEIAELVLDGVLEIEANGAYVSGSQAHRLIHGDARLESPQGTIAHRSIEALQYAQCLDISDVQKLAARLYFYGRQPLTPEWKRKFPTPQAVAEHLGVAPRGANRSLLDQDWFLLPASETFEAWRSWKSRYARTAHAHSQVTYKLYVSPAFEAVREAFQTTVQIITELRAPTFKVGRDILGLLRPDKIVVYFWNRATLDTAAGRLSSALSGYPAQGVPFSAELAGGGLLSWGIDPPPDAQLLEWQGRDSWRSWVAKRLAAALLSAKSTPTDTIEPWQFALSRIALEGVDTRSWTPTQKIWLEDIDDK